MGPFPFTRGEDSSFMKYIDVAEIDKEFSDYVRLTHEVCGAWYGTGHEAGSGIGGVATVVSHDEILSFWNGKLRFFYIHGKKGFSVTGEPQIALAEFYKICLSCCLQEYISSLKLNGIPG